MIDNCLNEGRVSLLLLHLSGAGMTVANTQVDAFGEVGEHSVLGGNKRSTTAARMVGSAADGLWKNKHCRMLNPPNSPHPHN